MATPTSLDDTAQNDDAPGRLATQPAPTSLRARSRAAFRTHRSSLMTFVLLGAERALQMAIGLYVAGSIARHFSHEDFANWQIAFSLWIVVGTLGSITGERVMLPRLCSARAEDLPTLWTTALASKLLSGVGTVALLLGWAATVKEPEVFQLALVWAAYLLVAEPVSLAIYECYAKDDFVTPQRVRITAMLLRLAAIATVLQLDLSLTWIVAGWLLEIVAMALLLCRHWIGDARWSVGRVDFALMREIFSNGAALALAAGASIALSRIDRVTLGATVPTEVLSQYAAAMTLLEAAFGFAAVLTSVVGAKTLFRPGVIPVAQHAGLVAFAAGIAIAGALMIAAVAEPLVALVFGDRYQDTAHYLRYAVALLPLVFAQAILQAPLLMRARNRFHLTKAVVALGIGIVAASTAARAGRYDLICVGAYLGYLTLIVFDLTELRRRRLQIYGEPVHAPR